jgi:hypothetical protein
MSHPLFLHRFFTPLSSSFFLPESCPEWHVIALGAKTKKTGIQAGTFWPGSVFSSVSRKGRNLRRSKIENQESQRARIPKSARTTRIATLTVCRIHRLNCRILSPCLSKALGDPCATPPSPPIQRMVHAFYLSIAYLATWSCPFLVFLAASAAEPG